MTGVPTRSSFSSRTTRTSGAWCATCSRARASPWRSPRRQRALDQILARKRARPRHPRPDAAGRGRPQRLPPAAQPRRHADPHADGQERSGRPRRRAGDGRRRLRHQAVRPARAARPRARAAAALPQPRGARRAEPSRRFAFEGLVIDLDARRLETEAGKPVALTSAEFDLLACFVTRPRRVLSRDQLLDWTRGRDADPFDRTIDMTISQAEEEGRDRGAGSQSHHHRPQQRLPVRARRQAAAPMIRLGFAARLFIIFVTSLVALQLLAVAGLLPAAQPGHRQRPAHAASRPGRGAGGAAGEHAQGAVAAAFCAPPAARTCACTSPRGVPRAARRPGTRRPWSS